ncbi:MAG: LytTR family DNA-binding domain-containing protein [Xanthomonadales bacterium]|nr:LytTR family DNA-binding domain-containing protein [Xanthomonadales bacterium]
MIRALIVDDEALARRGLEIRLASYPDIEICGESRNGREAIDATRTLRPDLVFLDIQMPGMDGFETLQELAGPEMPLVIFVTAYSDYAIKAFEANALDYLLKPIDDQRLNHAVERVRAVFENRNAVAHRSKLLKLICDLTGEDLTLDSVLDSTANTPPRRLAIKDGKRTACVDVADIDWVDAAGDYMCIHALGHTHVLRGTMKKMEQMLDSRRFVRIHRSTIVNADRVASLRSHINGEYFLTLKCGQELKLSRSYKDTVPRLTGAPQA